MLAQEAGEVGGDVALGATRELDADDLLEARVGRGARRGQPLELVRSPLTARSIGRAFVIET